MRQNILVLVLILAFSCNKSKNIDKNYSNLPENKKQLVVLDLSNLFSQTQIDSLSIKLFPITSAKFALTFFEVVMRCPPPKERPTIESENQYSINIF